MNKKLTSRTKIIIATSLAAILLVGAIVSIILVLAATQQNISSNITISYNVDGVGAKVSAKYGKIPEGAAATLTSMTTPDGRYDELEFNASDDQSERALTPNGNITLTQESGTAVIFEYRFENVAETAFAIGFNAEETGQTKNIKETFYYSKTALPTSEYGRVEYGDYAIQTLEYEEVIYIYVKVAVANINLNANYNKAYNWELNKIATEKVAITLNNGTGTGGMTSTNAYANAAVPALASVPTAPSGQVFLGYYDAATNGTQYISNTGAGIKEIAGAMTLYAQYKTVASVTTTGNNTTVSNTSDEELYVPTQAGTTFNYGGSEYTSNGEYLLLNPDQTVEMSNAANASYADNSSVISVLRPLDIAEKKFYSAYGEYPQTYVGNTLNETLKGLAESAKTGKKYTTDINNTTTYLDEYLYNGKKYAKLASVMKNEATNFSDGTTIVETAGTIYFFAVEPILCKAMEIGNGTATMMTVEMRGSMAFDDEGDFENWDESTFDNSWKNSDIRAYLNGAFLTESGLSSIAQSTSITNPVPFGYGTTTENTTDKIFIASAEEICKWSGSSYDQFVNDWWLDDENNSKRQISVSDMAKATYCYEYDGYGYYWLRSPGGTNYRVCHVYDGGLVLTTCSNFTDYGFCPAFVINL